MTTLSHPLPFENFTPQLGKNAWIAPGAIVIGQVVLGQNVSIWYNSVLRGDVELIQIGDETNIQDLTLIHADANEPTIIGKQVTVGHSAILHGCRVEDRCLIGMGARVLNNAVIGEESLVAAGTIIPPNKVFPPRSLIMGSPGKVVRTITDEQVEEFIQSAVHYAQNAIRHQNNLKNVKN